MQARQNLPKDVWFNYILPFLDKKSLYALASASKEARQMIFAMLFSDKAFSSRINRRIERLTVITDNRLPGCHMPTSEFELSIILGDDWATARWRCLEWCSLLFATGLIRSILDHSGGSDFALKLKIAGLATTLVMNRAGARLFESHNQKWFERDIEETERQKLLRLKKRRLIYLRDELPKLSFAQHSLFTRIRNHNEETLEHHAYQFDPGDTEPRFFRLKCAVNDYADCFRDAAADISRRFD